MDFLADLRARGLVHDSTDPAVLTARLAEGPMSIYVGFDPTADSLHVGHLLGQFTLRRFQLAGHRPFALAGGATGMVGDPSGKSEERNLLDAETLRHNVERIEGQLQRILDFEPGPCGATLVNNFDWTAPVGILEFLRDVGKHVTVNQMMAKDSVRSRMEGSAGISYTEFSYMLLQANDFRHLCERHGVEMQAGGSDQWGNITQGIDLIRRTLARSAFGLTWPLLTKADGTKFGKSAEGAVWLDPVRTSPYQFFQFWMGAEDADVGRLLRQFTFLSTEETDGLIAEHEGAPDKRAAQRRLAHEVTALVHGHTQADAVDSAARIVFGEDPREASEAVLEALAAELPKTTVAALPQDLTRFLVEVGVASSMSDARRGLEQRAFAVNGTKVTTGATIEASDLLRGRFIMLSKGRRTHHLVEIADRS